MTSLKPCPFCGGEAVLRHASFCGYDSQWVECTNRMKCGAKVEPVTDVPEVAIQAWNTRAERTCHLRRHGSLADWPEIVCWSCSECSFGWHHDINDMQFSYCPNCGAKVIGG